MIHNVNNKDKLQILEFVVIALCVMIGLAIRCWEPIKQSFVVLCILFVILAIFLKLAVLIIYLNHKRSIKTPPSNQIQPQL